jgi:excisionase family DNA binding protein
VDRGLLKIEEAARLLSLGRSKTYQLVMDGAIPSIHIGRSRRIPAAALERWIDQRTQEAEAGQRVVGRW